MNIVFVEDELITCEYLVQTAKSMTQEHIVGYQDPIKLIKELPAYKIDIAFLDINLIKMNGFELAETLQAYNPAVQIIFVTSYNNYATEAFEVNAVDYLLKPIRKERLNYALQKAILAVKSIQKVTKSQIQINLFSNLEVLIDKKPIHFKRQKSAELLAFLLLHQVAHKEMICDQLFEDFDHIKALSQMHTVVHQLRKDLVDISDYIHIDYTNQMYRLSLSNVQFDKVELESLWQINQKDKSEETYQKAIKLYNKGLLTQVDWPWTLEFQLLMEDKHVQLLKQYIKLLDQQQQTNTLKTVLIQLRPFIDELDLITYKPLFKKYFNETFYQKWLIDKK